MDFHFYKKCISNVHSPPELAIGDSKSGCQLCKAVNSCKQFATWKVKGYTYPVLSFTKADGSHSKEWAASKPGVPLLLCKRPEKLWSYTCTHVVQWCHLISLATRCLSCLIWCQVGGRWQNKLNLRLKLCHSIHPPSVAPITDTHKNSDFMWPLYSQF